MATLTGRRLLLFGASMAMAALITDQARADFAKGDIFAAVGDGKVNIFDSSGTFLQQLDDTTGATFTTGMTFDKAGNLYVTNFSSQSISQFNVHGGLTNATWASGLTNTPESIVFNKANTAAYVGGAHGGNIEALDASGHITSTISPGGDWVDLAADQHTLLYSAEGTTIASADINGTANPDFATGLPGSNDYALRILTNGDVLVADTDRVLELDSSGNVINTYCLGTTCNASGVAVLFALNVLPDQKSFLTGDLDTGMIYQVNIATGALEMSFSGLNGGTGTLAGLAVFGEFQAGGGGGGSTTPEPGTLMLLAMGIGVFAIVTIRRRVSSHHRS
ncbi:MAG TPA: PEP-CTERM sorting domain-containing protein [Bryobacteraceae bacterium]|nr:PEP-CTERM sorting domain-containing protein [Bryobacteraceae bacterium]